MVIHSVCLLAMCLFAPLFSAFGAQGGGGGGHQPDFSAAHEIQFLTGHTNHFTCTEMAKINCNTYHINGDEQICGTDGVTYSSQ